MSDSSIVTLSMCTLLPVVLRTTILSRKQIFPQGTSTLCNESSQLEHPDNVARTVVLIGLGYFRETDPVDRKVAAFGPKRNIPILSKGDL